MGIGDTDRIEPPTVIRRIVHNSFIDSSNNGCYDKHIYYRKHIFFHFNLTSLSVIVIYEATCVSEIIINFIRKTGVMKGAHPLPTAAGDMTSPDNFETDANNLKVTTIGAS